MSRTLGDRVTEHRSMAEKMLCAAALVNPDGARIQCGWLNPDRLHIEPYKRFWSAILDGKTSTDASMEAGIMGELLAASADVINTTDLVPYARAIVDDTYLTGVAEQLTEIAHAIASRDVQKTSTLLKTAAADLPEGVSTVPNAVDIALEYLDSLRKPSNIVRTGVASLDRAIGGMKPGNLLLLAARPSVGKTALAWQICRNVAASGKRALYCSPEMTARELWERAVCGLARVDPRVTHGEMDEATDEKIVNASTELMDRYQDRLMIYDNPRQSTEDLWRLTSQFHPDVLFFDHTSLASDPHPNEVIRLGMISWAGKEIAKGFKIPVVFLQQLSRQTELRQDHRPTMADLRDSGKLEENADTVLFLYRKDYYEEAGGSPPKISETDIIVGKNRSGSRNTTARVFFHLERQWFYEKSEISNL